VIIIDKTRSAAVAENADHSPFRLLTRIKSRKSCTTCSKSGLIWNHV